MEEGEPTAGTADGSDQPVGAHTDIKRGSSTASPASSKGLESSPTELHLRRLILRVLIAGLSLLWIAAILVRFSVRDRVNALAVIFYATPPAVLVVLALSICGLLFLQRSRRLALVALLLGASCGVYWWQTSFFDHAATATDASMNVFFWNCQRGKHGWDAIAEQIHQANAPLVGLVEAVTHSKKRKRYWRTEFSDYDVATPGGHIVLMTTGTIRQSRLVPLGDSSRCGVFEVVQDGRRLNVLVIDIRSNPFLSRRGAFDRLYPIIESYGDQPLLIMGDFNTPTDSYLFDRLRGNCQNAFEAGGHGNSATWPLPLPVLPLDQVWTNHLLRAERCRNIWTTRSDHRPVVTEFSFLPVKTP